MADRPSRPPDLVLAALAVIATVLVLSAMPPPLSATFAVVAAISWCIWLDRHPSP